MLGKNALPPKPSPSWDEAVGEGALPYESDRMILAMSKGMTTLTFHGGPSDGEVLTNVPSMRVFPLVHLPTGSGFTEEADGQMGVFAKAGELPSNWFIFKTARYAKRETDSGRTSVHYDFVEEALISRCRAITLKGGWCKNEAVPDQKVCKTHTRAANLELKPDA